MLSQKNKKMTKFYSFSLCLIALSFVSLVISESVKRVECNTGASRVRLCCDKNAPDLQCADLSLMPKDKNLKPRMKILEGRSCEEMFVDNDYGNFCQ
jgi:hypothetical protein